MSFPDIRELLPHRSPMLWLDSVIAHRDDAVRCRLTVREDHLFVEAGRVEAVVAVEWIAQAVGALVGLRDRSQAITPRPGYLIAVPEATFFVDTLRVGDVLDVGAWRTWGDEALGSFEGDVQLGATLVASAKLSVYRPPLPESAPA